MKQENDGPPPPPTPVLVGDEAAQLLKAAGFPTWFHSLVGLVGGVLLGQSVALIIFFLAGLYSELHLHYRMTSGKIITFALLLLVALTSFVAGVFLAIASRGVNRIYDAAKEKM